MTIIGQGLPPATGLGSSSGVCKAGTATAKLSYTVTLFPNQEEARADLDKGVQPIGQALVDRCFEGAKLSGVKFTIEIQLAPTDGTRKALSVKVKSSKPVPKEVTELLTQLVQQNLSFKGSGTQVITSLTIPKY